MAALQSRRQHDVFRIHCLKPTRAASSMSWCSDNISSTTASKLNMTAALGGGQRSQSFFQLATHVPIHMSLHMSLHMSVHMSMHMRIHMSIHSKYLYTIFDGWFNGMLDGMFGDTMGGSLGVDPGGDPMQLDGTFNEPFDVMSGGCGCGNCGSSACWLSCSGIFWPVHKCICHTI